LQRAIGSMTRTGLRAGSKALKQAMRAPAAGSRPAAGLLADPSGRRGLKGCVAGMAFSAGGARRYYLYKPPDLALAERLPLLVMLHGCGQDANGFSMSTRMNRVAARERFMVLYPEQDPLANPQRCWNWFETRSRRAQGEAAIVLAAIDQVCLLYPVDPSRIAIAGMSAGASMAALLAARHPGRFKAVVMHSGVPPGAADSAASAMRAMRGHRLPPTPPGAVSWPPLLVIQGSSDRVVAAMNGAAAARHWASAVGASEITVRQVRRGARHPMTVTDFKSGGTVAATLCEVERLGHAWSGGAAGQRFSDAEGPDASRMVWAFIARCFAARATPPPA